MAAVTLAMAAGVLGAPGAVSHDRFEDEAATELELSYGAGHVSAFVDRRTGQLVQYGPTTAEAIHRNQRYGGESSRYADGTGTGWIRLDPSIQPVRVHWPDGGAPAAADVPSGFPWRFHAVMGRGPDGPTLDGVPLVAVRDGTEGLTAVLVDPAELAGFLLADDDQQLELRGEYTLTSWLPDADEVMVERALTVVVHQHGRVRPQSVRGLLQVVFQDRLLDPDRPAEWTTDAFDEGLNIVRVGGRPFVRSGRLLSRPLVEPTVTELQRIARPNVTVLAEDRYLHVDADGHWELRLRRADDGGMDVVAVNAAEVGALMRGVVPSRVDERVAELRPSPASAAAEEERSGDAPTADEEESARDERTAQVPLDG